ncbi:MAG: hypothetical protein DWQ34_06070 [Planctomycetota bacterium]|nr:MAG: hypothetical protein DWQ34_06070 [Planctomycetota bacterium]
MHVASGEVQPAKPQPIRDVDRLQQRIVPVDHLPLRGTQEIGETPLCVPVEEHRARTLADFERRLGHKVHGPPLVNELDD